MDNYNFDQYDRFGSGEAPQQDLILAQAVPEPSPGQPARRHGFRRRVRLPVLLFVATCLSTLLLGTVQFGLATGWQYAAAVMIILVCHEAGHFLQAHRYGVYASLPYFVPMPISPIGTLGAVIAMEPRMGNRRAVFDIGISGPLAGLVPTLAFCIIGLKLAEAVPVHQTEEGIRYGTPIVFDTLAQWLLKPPGEGMAYVWNPLMFAGWVGLLITALNLVPIGQLDGGHILYGLLRSRAHMVAALLLVAAAAGVAIYWDQLKNWTLMVILLMLMGPVHPPTANDEVPLGFGRSILGWLTLAFIPIGFTPVPFDFGR